jgi:hypothetical protein
MVTWYLHDMYRRWREKTLLYIVWKLPKEIVYWSFIRVSAHATTGQYGKHNPHDVSIMDALERWE